MATKAKTKRLKWKTQHSQFLSRSLTVGGEKVGWITRIWGDADLWHWTLFFWDGHTWHNDGSFSGRSASNAMPEAEACDKLLNAFAAVN